MATLTKEIKAMKMGREAGTTERDKEDRFSLLAPIYQRYAANVYTLCLRLLANVRAAEEATVSVFVRFSREMARRWDESRVLARLRELSIDEALSRLKAREPKVEPPTAATSLPERAQGGPQAALDRATLDALVAHLPDRLRVAFVLRDREGLSEGATANHLRINQVEVRRLVHEARLEVRRLWLGQTSQ